MKRQALSQKILCLGVDGLDPRLTRKYVDEGKMPHVQELIERGACRSDLVLLGGHPTVTPPMWTTLATGCYANVHGITGFYRLDLEHGDLDQEAYNLDSRNCHAEPLWNVFAEAGKKTLVWHWPGSSWPPTSDSPNLMVVDGTVPGSVNVSAQKNSSSLPGQTSKCPVLSLPLRKISRRPVSSKMFKSSGMLHLWALKIKAWGQWSACRLSAA